ncbi:autophagy protein 6 [Lambiella insularis]|nr:autophagy protein 6 [Lambiella insularis]
MNCQQCRTPLVLDPSLQDLNPAAFDLLVGSGAQPLQPRSTPSRLPYPADRNEKLAQAAQHAQPPRFKHKLPQVQNATAPGAGPLNNPAMSFVMLTESQLQPPSIASSNAKGGSVKELVASTTPAKNGTPATPQQSLSHKIDYSTRLFEILSSRSDIDHPICTDCTDILLSQLQARLSASIKERDAYINFLKQLKNNVPTPAEVAEAEAELAAGKEREEKAFAELIALEKEKAKLANEISQLEIDSRALDEEEEGFWRAHNSLALTLSSFQEERDSLNAAYEHDAQQLERLQRTNVYNDTFCIGHDGNFGTINGLRLGRLPPPNNIEWAEINAAWGTTALLLATVADRLGFFFRGYRIRPMGSTSHIDRIEYSQSPSAPSLSHSSKVTTGPSANPGSRAQQPKVTSLELFSSGDLPLGKTILHRRFNDAMVAFLDCLWQLGEYVKNDEQQTMRSQQAEGLKLPYKIERDKIHGVSIKLGISQDEAWTHACKYTLTCCKFLLAHASNVAGTNSSKSKEKT